MAFRYVAVGNDGGPSLSNSLDSWFQPDNPPDPEWTPALVNVVAGGGYFVTADDNEGYVFRSTDGQFWEQSSTTDDITRTDELYYSEASGYFHLLAYDDHWRSVDGLNWINAGTVPRNSWYQGCPIYEENNDLYYVAGGRELCVIRDQGDGVREVVDWDIGVGAPARIAYGNGYYVISGWDNNTDENWIVVRGESLDSLEVLFEDTDNTVKFDATFFNGMFYTIDWNSDGGVYRSEDGANWERVYSPMTGAYSIDYFEENGLLVVGGNGQVAYSEDGISWIESDPFPDAYKIYAVALREMVVNFWFAFAGTREVL